MNHWAAIFDWDGVVVDSLEPHRESWIELAREEGLPLREGDFERGFGMKNQPIIMNLYRWTGDPAEADRLADRKEVIFRDILRRGGVTVLPGARELLSELNAGGVPCVVGSSTPRLNLDCAIEIGGLSGLFASIVCADDVHRGKPDPEVFLKAAAAAGVAPSRCVVLEDAPTGIEAGLAAGMKVFAVATTRPPDMLGAAHHVAPSLAGVRRRDLERLLSVDPSARPCQPSAQGSQGIP